MKAHLYRNIVILVYVLLLPLVGFAQRAGDLDRSFNYGRGENYGNGSNATVTSTLLQANGKIIIGGGFTTYNGIAKNRIARLNIDGSLDSTFNLGTGPNNWVSTAALQPDGKIIIGGGFTSFDGITTNHLARLLTNGSLDTSFNPRSGANSGVRSITLQPDGKIIIGGDFTSFDGITRNRIARLNTDGTLDTTFNPGTGVNNVILTTALQNDGKIILGGDFNTFNDINRNRIARLNADGSLDITFNPGTGANLFVSTTAVQADGKVIIGGRFTSYNNTTTNRIARLNADGSFDASFNVGSGASSIVHIVNLQLDGKVIIGGEFDSYNGILSKKLIRVHSNGSVDLSFNTGTGVEGGVMGFVSSIVIKSNDKILIGGDFYFYNSNFRSHISCLNSNGSLDSSFNYMIGTNNYVYTTSVNNNGKIIIGGIFTSYNGINTNHIASLNEDGSLDTSFNPGFGANSWVKSISVKANGKIIIGGNFTSFNRTNKNRIVSLNEDGSLDTSFNPGSGANNAVLSSALQTDGKIIIGGNFTFYNNISRRYLARLNGNGSLDFSFNPGTGIAGTDFPQINTIAIQDDGKIIIGGSFNTYNGVPRNGIARLNIDGSLDNSFNPGSHIIENCLVHSIALQQDGKIIVAGVFIDRYWIPRRNIARFNANGSLDRSFNVGTGSEAVINTIAIQSNGKIVIGGNFHTFNNSDRRCLARLNANGSLDVTFNSSTGVNNAVFTSALQSDGKIILCGAFTTSVSGFSTPGITRVYGFDCSIPAPIQVTGNTSFCFGESTLLTSSQLTGNLWNTGDTTRSIVVTSPGEYTIRTMNNGCTTAYSGIIRVTTLDSIITPAISGDTTICSSTSTRLTSSSPTGNLWSTGDTTQFINVAQAGNYSVRVINSGCTSAVSAPFRVVNAGPSPTVINFDTTSNLCLGARLQLTPAGTFAHYQWNTGERTRSIYTRTSGQYSVQVANSDSCFGLPSPPIFIAFDTNWCSVEIFRVGIDSITANVWADYYIWYLNGIELLSSNTLKTIPVQGEGVYTFRAVIGGRTSPLSNPIVISSAKKSLVAKFEVYPNPATNKVTVNTSETGTLEILNTLGQVVITQPATATNELNISHLAKGVYTVRFNGASKMLVVK